MKQERATKIEKLEVFLYYDETGVLKTRPNHCRHLVYKEEIKKNIYLKKKNEKNIEHVIHNYTTTTSHQNHPIERKKKKKNKDIKNTRLFNVMFLRNLKSKN